MAMDYGKCAREIYETLGGRENLVSAAHCATRLRLVTVDNGRIDKKKRSLPATGRLPPLLTAATPSA